MQTLRYNDQGSSLRVSGNKLGPSMLSDFALAKSYRSMSAYDDLFQKLSKCSLQKIGVVDSGLGGLTILNKLIKVFPAQYVYLADTKNLPYGEKSNDQLIHIAFDAIDVLISHEVDAIIIACHTLSAVALEALQKKYPHMLFIGMIEGVVQRAYRQTRVGTIGIIATSATIKTSAHKKALLQLDPSLHVFEQACPALVPAIEQVPINSDQINKLLDVYLQDFRKQNMDTLILGCTHYALIKDSITKACNDSMCLVSADEEIEQIFSKMPIPTNHSPSTVSFLVSGNKEEFFSKLPRYFTHVNSI